MTKLKVKIRATGSLKEITDALKEVQELLTSPELKSGNYILLEGENVKLKITPYYEIEPKG